MSLLEQFLKQPKLTVVHFNCEQCGKHVHKQVSALKRKPYLLCKSCLMKKLYGVTSNISRPSARDKSKQTKQERYGDPYYTNPDKVKETVKQKYGVENVFQLESVKLKTKETNTQKYNVSSYPLSEEYQLTAHKKYLYHNISFDSSWELAFWIWCEDHHMNIQRNIGYDVLPNGKHINIDFRVDEQLYEIKGDIFKQKEDWLIREQYYKEHNVTVLFKHEIKPILEYITKAYGKDYLNSFRKLEYESYIDLDKEKAENISAHKQVCYSCNMCSEKVYTTYKRYITLNGLCKKCSILKKSTN